MIFKVCSTCSKQYGSIRRRWTRAASRTRATLWTGAASRRHRRSRSARLCGRRGPHPQSPRPCTRTHHSSSLAFPLRRPLSALKRTGCNSRYSSIRWRYSSRGPQRLWRRRSRSDLRSVPAVLNGGRTARPRGTHWAAMARATAVWPVRDRARAPPATPPTAAQSTTWTRASRLVRASYRRSAVALHTSRRVSGSSSRRSHLAIIRAQHWTRQTMRWARQTWAIRAMASNRAQVRRATQIVTLELLFHHQRQLIDFAKYSVANWTRLLINNPLRFYIARTYCKGLIHVSFLLAGLYGFRCNHCLSPLRAPRCLRSLCFSSK